MNKTTLIAFGFAIYCLFSGSAGYAGLFSSEPPKAFLSLPVEGINNQYEDVTFTVGEVKTFYEKAGSAVWEKSNDTQWILRIVAKDQVTGNKTKMNIVFAKDGATAIPTRITVDGAEANSSEILSILSVPASVIGKRVAKTKSSKNKADGKKHTPTEFEKEAKRQQDEQNSQLDGSDKQLAQANKAEQDAMKRDELAKSKTASDENSQRRLVNIKAIPGHYENSQGRANGTVDVKTITDSKIEVTYSGPGCKFENKAVDLTFNDVSHKGTLRGGPCEIDFSFRSVGTENALSINDRGDCKNICGGSGNVLGDFRKKK